MKNTTLRILGCVALLVLGTSAAWAVPGTSHPVPDVGASALLLGVATGGVALVSRVLGRRSKS